MRQNFGSTFGNFKFSKAVRLPSPEVKKKPSEQPEGIITDMKLMASEKNSDAIPVSKMNELERSRQYSVFSFIQPAFGK